MVKEWWAGELGGRRATFSPASEPSPAVAAQALRNGCAVSACPFLPATLSQS